jgi:hypothetical protein
LKDAPPGARVARKVLETIQHLANTKTATVTARIKNAGLDASLP